MKKTVDKDGYVFIGKNYANSDVEIKFISKLKVKTANEYFDFVSDNLSKLKDIKINEIYDGSMSFIIECAGIQYYLRPIYCKYKSIPAVEVSRGLSAFAILKAAYPKLDKAILITNAFVDCDLIGVKEEVKKYIKIFTVDSENSFSEAILTVMQTQA